MHVTNNNVQGLCDGDCADAALHVVCKHMSVLRRADINAISRRQQTKGNKCNEGSVHGLTYIVGTSYGYAS